MLLMELSPSHFFAKRPAPQLEVLSPLQVFPAVSMLTLGMSLHVGGVGGGSAKRVGGGSAKRKTCNHCGGTTCSGPSS